MNKHTPGPWENRHFNAYGEIVITSPYWRNQSLCDQMVKVAPRRNYVDGIGLHITEDAVEEAEADARLIAAAPELLKALRPFADLLEYPFDCSEEFLNLVVCVSDIRAAVAAIAKATGEDK